MKINNQFKLGDLVYLVHDPECYTRMIIAITVNITGCIAYSLVCGSEYTDNYEDEIVADKPVR